MDLQFARAGRSLLLVLVVAVAANAGEPVVRFDYAHTLASHDVTPEGFEQTHPGKKLVEVPISVSVHVLDGDAADVEEVRFQVQDDDRRMRVDGFSPQTTLESRFADDIKVTKTSELDKSIGASLGGEAPITLGSVAAQVTPSISGGFSKSDIVTETSVRRAPKETLVVAGTVESSHGVLFKLRPSPQTTIEGLHHLRVRFIVPAGWRADELKLRCTASGSEKVLWIRQQTKWADASGSIAVYLAGDSEARAAAEEFARLVARN